MKASQHKQSLTTLLALTFMICLTSSYTLEGLWDLTPQHLAYTTSEPHTSFRFVNKVVQPAILPTQDTLGGSSTSVFHKGTNQVTVHACKTLLYNYYVK